VTGGRLTVDAGAYPRYTASIDLGDLTLAPRRASDPLTPFGARVTLDYTIADGTGRTAWVRPCPPLIVDGVDVGRGRSTGLTVTASDPSLTVDVDAFLAATDPPVGARTVSEAVAYLIRRTDPDAVIRDSVDSAAPLGDGYQFDGSPWALIEELADGTGAECFVDLDAAYVFRPVLPIGDPAGVLAVGKGGTIVGTRSRVVRGHNRVALRFRDAAGAPVIGVWADRSGGPTDVSRMGRVTLVESRDRRASPSQADAAAATYGRRVAGRIRDVEVEAVAAPWFEPGDTIDVTFPTGTDRLVLRTVEHDLTAAEASRYVFRTDTLGPV
jgi:hypothetical protein